MVLASGDRAASDEPCALAGGGRDECPRPCCLAAARACSMAFSSGSSTWVRSFSGASSSSTSVTGSRSVGSLSTASMMSLVSGRWAFGSVRGASSSSSVRMRRVPSEPKA